MTDPRHLGITYRGWILLFIDLIRLVDFLATFANKEIDWRIGLAFALYIVSLFVGGLM